jgi:hypothetical protein
MAIGQYASGAQRLESLFAAGCLAATLGFSAPVGRR